MPTLYDKYKLMKKKYSSTSIIINYAHGKLVKLAVYFIILSMFETSIINFTPTFVDTFTIVIIRVQKYGGITGHCCCCSSA